MVFADFIGIKKHYLLFVLGGLNFKSASITNKTVRACPNSKGVFIVCAIANKITVKNARCIHWQALVMVGSNVIIINDRLKAFAALGKLVTIKMLVRLARKVFSG